MRYTHSTGTAGDHKTCWNQRQKSS